MQFVQNQGIYYWTQQTYSEVECQKFATYAKSKNWLAGNGWYQCQRLPNNGQWEFRMARRPTTTRGNAKVVQVDWNPYGDIVNIGTVPDKDGRLCYVQERSGNAFDNGGFAQASAALNKWGDDRLKAAGYLFDMSDVFKASRDCQNTLGDPFAPNEPQQALFYPAMQIQSTADQILSGVLPKCLFNIPIFQVGEGDTKNDWCKPRIGAMHANVKSLYPPYFKPDHDPCGSTLELWALQSDTKLCRTDNRDFQSSTGSPKPGCEKHDRGIHIVPLSR
ncbi:hypothetical protein LTR10_018915 [Elasticomyces elasticus]|uniref:Uncharacterized protein n=1 Tax=Exophiala sideris TaxID=1016849 RepID=A0ABR0JJ93_9EURO|nr:hypothetical protein LTR10_018915 [Elasticomyces elasticus]KAK5034440.1 hypothetical protein LTS07_003361 [Exophiala sideris]KAK5042737.1 hypothetical protein LTR13_001585 [Exophiala sideris]KAK5065820.1 hypothetical protein LTR69_003370 [Exophiala sideris]KAK5185719.1 hypothetical protein LTR44_001768 [Eurotiomycetes sp. CCFEE 6388]